MVELHAWAELHAHTMEEANICVMGIPFDGAVSCGKGAAIAPEKIRGLSRYLPPYTDKGDRITSKVYDEGDVPFDLNWEKYFAQVEEKAFCLLDTEKFCLFIGGDHSVTIPLHRGFFRKHQGKKVGIIHFDSHADICDTYDGHKWSHACTERRAIEQLETPEDIAFVGLRSWEEEEVEYFKQHPDIMVKRAYDVFKEGYQAIIDQLVEKFNTYDVIYLSLDIDVLDPAYAPGTGTPEAGGLTSRELIEMVTQLMEKLPISAMDIVEVSPPLDSINHITSWAALKIMYEVFYCIR